MIFIVYNNASFLVNELSVVEHFSLITEHLLILSVILQ